MAQEILAILYNSWILRKTIPLQNHIMCVQTVLTNLMFFQTLSDSPDWIPFCLLIDLDTKNIKIHQVLGKLWLKQVEGAPGEHGGHQDGHVRRHVLNVFFCYLLSYSSYHDVTYIILILRFCKSHTWAESSNLRYFRIFNIMKLSKCIFIRPHMNPEFTRVWVLPIRNDNS